MLIKSVLGILFASMLTMVGPAEAKSTVVCEDFKRHDVVTHDDGSLNESKWRIKYVVGFRWCNNRSNGNKWAKPLYSVGIYNREGDSMSCDTVTGTNVLLYVGFNPYMWAYNGVNYNPGEFKVPCDKSTSNVDFQRYENAPRLYKAGTSHPKWKANWRIEKTGVLFQGSGTLSGRFRPCDGRRRCG